jgi:RNA polymerase sigma-B factor
VTATASERKTGSTVSDVELESLPREERTRRLLRAATEATSATERARVEMQVIEANMPVAAQIAARYRRRGVADDDLEQVAYLALVKCVRRYEYAEDRDFLSFAVPTIRGELRRYFRDLGWMVRPTRQIQDAQTRIAGAEGELLQELGRAPRPSELAERLGLGLDVVVEALSANGCFHPSSLDTAAVDRMDGLGDRLGIEDAGFRRAEARAVLSMVTGGLTERERTMIEMRFFRGATQAEIGEVLGVTQMQVSRLLSNLMARLREQVAGREGATHRHRQTA